MSQSVESVTSNSYELQELTQNHTVSTVSELAFQDSAFTVTSQPPAKNISKFYVQGSCVYLKHLRTNTWEQTISPNYIVCLSNISSTVFIASSICSGIGSCLLCTCIASSNPLASTAVFFVFGSITIGSVAGTNSIALQIKKKWGRDFYEFDSFKDLDGYLNELDQNLWQLVEQFELDDNEISAETHDVDYRILCDLIDLYLSSASKTHFLRDPIFIKDWTSPISAREVEKIAETGFRLPNGKSFNVQEVIPIAKYTETQMQYLKLMSQCFYALEKKDFRKALLLLKKLEAANGHLRAKREAGISRYFNLSKLCFS
ncbi:hypothetical protein D5018_14835 [Parashewanella curva]|uniref:Uncharacterized protein n=1 Tax=Parashewanella curva TaxID=2338552 RepID=A0A3L8PU15_9GAMM|nr:hypothetical protein [Parashewanella curva]RLV58881.1 hypothetical protein D5018_14835 [Parashewanella curva]